MKLKSPCRFYATGVSNALKLCMCIKSNRAHSLQRLCHALSLNWMVLHVLVNFFGGWKFGGGPGIDCFPGKRWLANPGGGKGV